MGEFKIFKVRMEDIPLKKSIRVHGTSLAVQSLSSSAAKKRSNKVQCDQVDGPTGLMAVGELN